jgi:mono/diheme cytochrome c family protein
MQQSKGGVSNGVALHTQTASAAAFLTLALGVDQVCHGLTAAQQLADDSLVQGRPQLPQQQVPDTLPRRVMLLPIIMQSI